MLSLQVTHFVEVVNTSIIESDSSNIFSFMLHLDGFYLDERASSCEPHGAP